MRPLTLNGSLEMLGLCGSETRRENLPAVLSLAAIDVDTEDLSLFPPLQLAISTTLTFENDPPLREAVNLTGWCCEVEPA